MATISPNTFNPLRGYVGVRLQQGVPIVDADENEREDVRRFELRAFLKWFVGNGVPAGNGGFLVEGTGLANDFQIRAGITPPVDALDNVGRCLVEGLDVIITADTSFAGQPLHESNGAAAVTEAARVGAPMVSALTPPVADGTVVAYLDVWERLVTPAEDPTLVLPGLGTESCARVKREWVVRVRPGTLAPQPGDPDFLGDAPGEVRHYYYALAHIRRRAAGPGNAIVNASDVTDRREQRLLATPSTLVTDVLGADPIAYRRGAERPPISLREAINALLRGELPSTPDAAIFPDPSQDFFRRGLLLDATGGLVAVWHSNRFAATNQVLAARLARDNVGAGFVDLQQLTSGAAHADPHAALLANGDLLVVYTTGSGAASDITLKRAPMTGLAAAPEVPVAATAGIAETLPSVVVSGEIATVVFHSAGPSQWQFRRRRHTDNTWLDPVPKQLSAVVAPQRDLHAARHPSGHVWSAFVIPAAGPGTNIGVVRLHPPTTVVDNEESHDTGGASADARPFVLCSAGGDVWVFWQSGVGLHSRRFRAGAWGPIDSVTNTAAGDREPCAIEGSDGGIWLFWSRGAIGSGDLFVMRRHPASGIWAQPRQLTLAAEEDTSPFAVVAPDEAVWTCWLSGRDLNPNLFFKRLITTL